MNQPSSSASREMISALVVAHNEGHQLAACLETLRFADEIVVILDRCTDHSKDIAQSFGARIDEGAWPIEADRRNHGIAQCRGSWILEVDADERIPAELASVIRTTVQTSKADYHRLAVDNHIGARRVRYGWGAYIGNRHSVRLFRASVKTWGHGHVHPSVTLKGQGGPDLWPPFLHYTDHDWSDVLRRFDRYTTGHARTLQERQTIPSIASDMRRFATRFFKCYVMRQGFREGGFGFVIAVLAGLYPIVSNLKARQLIATTKDSV